MDSSEERLTEPAKLADRVIAPGEGSAEPGGTKSKMLLSHEVCDRGWKMNEQWGKSSQILVTNRLSPASQAQAGFTTVPPRLVKALARGYHSVRQLRRLG